MFALLRRLLVGWLLVRLLRRVTRSGSGAPRR
jgi:hypothetical protein